LQRLCLREENLGFFASFTRFAVVAMNSFFLETRNLKLETSYARNGIPRCFSSVRAWSSEPAVVTMVTFIPFILSTFA
jgi:hypothetical protein